MLARTLETRTLELSSGLSTQVITGGDGPPLLYFHSASVVTTADPFLKALASSFTVFAPVAPGFENLDDLRRMRTVHDVVLHYDDVVQALSLGQGMVGGAAKNKMESDSEQFTLVGHSFGGMFAAEYAAHYPSKVKHLVLMAPVGLWDDEFPVVDLFATPALELQGLLWGDTESPEAKAGQAAIMDGAGGDTASNIVESTLNLVRGLVTAGKFMMPIPDRGLNRRLYRISAPTLLLWGENDHLVPTQYAQKFATGITGENTSQITGQNTGYCAGDTDTGDTGTGTNGSATKDLGATIKIFPKAGHMLTLEYTEEVASQIIAFAG